MKLTKGHDVWHSYFAYDDYLPLPLIPKTRFHDEDAFESANNPFFNRKTLF